MELTNGSNRGASIHLIIALGIFGVYGVQVCPFLESLSVVALMLPVIIVLLAIFTVRSPLIAYFELAKSAEQVETGKYWWLHFGLFFAAGVALTLYNSIIYNFPYESGLKVLLGLATLGFFVATDLALQMEKTQAKALHRQQRQLRPKDKFMPLTQKFTLFACANAFFMAGIIFLVINKDLHWLTDPNLRVTLLQAQQTILFEVGFVVTVILAYTLKVIYSYSQNLSYFLHFQNITLQRAAEGDLTARAPVTTHDEFGVMAHHTNLMIDDLARFTHEIKQTRDVAILGLSSLAEARDNETGAHILRTQFYVKALAEYLKQQPRYRDYLDDQMIDLLHKSAPLHDIGKVGIPDAILLKPGKLTDEEFEIMKQHPAIGAQSIANAEAQLGSNSFLRFAREIAETHHEKWDGSGYPNGLKGSDIPLSGRLMALADVYDALISKRVYKAAFSHEKAKGIILEGRGSHFDPEIIDAFLACEKVFIEIANRYSDK